jgi:uncharacterized protein (TIGR00251 family)
MIECVRVGTEGVYIDLHVSPGSKKAGLDYDPFTKRLRVKVSSPAVDGKANVRLITLFRELLGPCELVSGQKSRKKTILVRNSDAGTISGLLEHALKPDG